MEKIYSAIMGLVVGDALGVPYEFRERDTFKAEGMTGYGTHDQPIGTWSDDSSLTLATMDSITKAGINTSDMMYSFYRWLRFADYTAADEVFDIGLATHRAIIRYEDGISPRLCGGTEEWTNGNGALMRILPLAFVPHSINDIHAIAGLTHAHDISKYACEIYLDVAAGILAGKKKRRATYGLRASDYGVEFERIDYIGILERNEIKSTGYVVHTLEAALWCLLKTDSYRDCVLTAVNLGGDTDTIAAVAGGLAGILYGVGGEKGIPEEWISQIARRDYIEELCKAFAERAKEDFAEWERR